MLQRQGTQILFKAAARLGSETRPPFWAPVSTVKSSSLTHRSMVAATPRRHYSTPILEEEFKKRQEGRFRITNGQLFGGLVVVGLFVTVYGVLEWYFAFSTWPQQVRVPLRKAIRYKHQGDLVKSEKYLIIALDAANDMPLSTLGSNPLLKLTGLYITLASLYESMGKTRTAFRTLQKGLDLIDSYEPKNGYTGTVQPSIAPMSSESSSNRPVRPPPPQGPQEVIYYELTDRDRTRAIALAQKMGSLALTASETSDASGKVDKEWESLAESYLVRALESMIALGARRGTKPGETQVVGRDFDFPDELETLSQSVQDKGDVEVDGERVAKVSRKSMGLVMEGLADLYAKRRQFDRANPLYLQAISTLLPSDEKTTQHFKPTIADKCQASVLMNTLSSSILNPPSSQNITASKAWSLRSLQLLDKTFKEAQNDNKTGVPPPYIGICEQARVVAEFNMGALEEMEHNTSGAFKYLKQSLEHSRSLNFAEGMAEAEHALERLASKTRR